MMVSSEGGNKPMVTSRIFTLVILVVCKLSLLKADQENSNHAFDEFEVVGIKFGPIFDSAIHYGKKIAITYDDASYKSYTTNDKISNMIGWMCARNGASGAGVSVTGQIGSTFTAGLASPLFFSGQVTLSVLISLYIQIALASGMAHLHGLDVNEGFVQTLMLGMVLRDVGTEFVRFSISLAAAKGARAAVLPINREFIRSLLFPLLGQRLLAIEGNNGLINLGSWVPFVGPLVSLFLDTSICIAAANTFDMAIFKMAGYTTGFSKTVLVDALKNKQINQAIYNALDSHMWDVEKLCKSGPMGYQTLKLSANDRQLLSQYAIDYCEKIGYK